MRRSVREALVGFSLLAAVGSGLGLWMWLRGISLSRNNWTVQASFVDAAGLAARSPVSFRGVLVGNVRRIRVTDQAVLADLEINDPKLRLSRPVVARVGASSLLGGDAVVSLISDGPPLPKSTPGPRSPACDPKRLVCDGGKVRGVVAPSIDTVTETVQRLLDDADRQKLVPQMVAATKTFEQAAKEAEQLTRQSQGFVTDAQGLVKGLDPLVAKAEPILENLDAASADAAAASSNVKQFTAALDDPRTVADLQTTLANARKLTARWEAVGGDVRKLTGDASFIDGIRSVSVGLGKFFEELYPAGIDAARQRDERKKARKEAARVRKQEAEERLAPSSRFDRN